jgi:D-beta-D-heptose 7-phosphate kinase/D-beta-D-heptose 1-phosphate adenosyltransferase
MIIRVDVDDKCEQIDEPVRMNICNNRYHGTVYDAIIISDYCKGFLTELDIELICKSNKNVFMDTKKIFGKWATYADYIKINSLEFDRNKEIIPKYSELNEKLIVTRGRYGCNFRDKLFSVEEVSVKDVSGAGDTFLAALVSEYLKSEDIEKSIRFAQLCTTKVVQKHGVSTV